MKCGTLLVTLHTRVLCAYTKPGTFHSNVTSHNGPTRYSSCPVGETYLLPYSQELAEQRFNGEAEPWGHSPLAEALR